MNAVEMEEAISQLAEQPLDPDEQCFKIKLAIKLRYASVHGNCISTILADFCKASGQIATRQLPRK